MEHQGLGLEPQAYRAALSAPQGKCPAPIKARRVPRTVSVAGLRNQNQVIGSCPHHPWVYCSTDW